MEKSYEKMNLILTAILFIFISNFRQIDATNAYLVPKSVVTQIGASYVLMLKHDTIIPVECYIYDVVGQQKYSVQLYNQGVTPSPVSNETLKLYTILTNLIEDIKNTTSYFGNGILKQSSVLAQSRADEPNSITSLGNGICGFKMDSVAANTPNKWNITFVDQLRQTYYGVATVVTRPTYPRHVVKYEKVGGYFSIPCADLSAGDLVYDLLNCKLFNPQNVLVKTDKRDCYFGLEQARVSDFGVWKCLLTFNSHMLPTEVTYEFKPRETNIVQTWTNETDNHVNIGCSVTNATQLVDYCIMVRPDGEQIILRPGLATKRYTALDTDFAKYTCSMQIVVPLLETEKGLWRCEQFYPTYGSLGGFVNVSAENTKYKPVPQIPQVTTVGINETLSISCRVPFSTPYCYMRGPDGFMYPLNDNRKNSLGLCEFKKEKAQLSDNGTWVCGFGKKTGEVDEVYSFQVYISESIPIQPEEQEIESRSAGTAKLLCSTKGLGDYPLKYCRFLSPDSKMYQIENHQTSDRISYAGRGLEFGDCGITLQDVSDSDQGTWSCITRIERINILGMNDDTEEVYSNIHLSINDSLSLASTLGISFGVSIVVITGIVYFVHRYLKRRNYQTNFPESNLGPNLNLDDDNNDIVFNVLQDNIPAGRRTYNATDSATPRGVTQGQQSNPFERSGSDSDENNVILDIIDDTTRVRN